MRRRRVSRIALAAVAATGLALSLSAERASMERANRLQREGRHGEAAELYRARTPSAPSDPELRYNLGTTLAALDSTGAEAEVELARASPAGTREVQGRARYNIGLVRLRRALGASDPDSVRASAAAAIEANRTSLRLRPESPNAKWNLAMALRLLDSLEAVERRSGRELQDGAVEADVVTRSVNVPDPAEDEFAEDPPAEGEQETAAVMGDESPLTLAEAVELLGTSHLDATEMLEKLLALEGRSHMFRPRPGNVRRW